MPVKSSAPCGRLGCSAVVAVGYKASIALGVAASSLTVSLSSDRGDTWRRLALIDVPLQQAAGHPAILQVVKALSCYLLKNSK